MGALGARGGAAVSKRAETEDACGSFPSVTDTTHEEEEDQDKDKDTAGSGQGQ